MTEQQAETFIHHVKAESVGAGARFLTRSGEHSAPVADTAVVPDDFGTPAMVVATLEDGSRVRIAHGSRIRIASSRRPAQLPGALAQDDLELIPAEEGTPEAVVVAVARAHGRNAGVQRLAARLSRGLNAKAGSHLQDVRDLAHTLFVELDDPERALTVCRLIIDQPFDGNFGRWKWIQSALAMAAYILRESGGEEDHAEALRLAEALRAPDDADEDPFRAKINAEVRQRQLNEPNLYDKEIHRAMAAADRAAEREWRELRLTALLYLRTHGGSETLEPVELDRRISNELVAIRALDVQQRNF
ncbi:MAG: DUF6707 family protein [Actinomycetota bacterium]